MKKKEKLHYLIILDQSGSMQGMKNTVIDVFNEQLQSLKKASSEIDLEVTMAVFNDRVDILNLNVNIDQVQELNSRNYQPDCMTALYDAIMISYNRMKVKVKKKERVVVLVLTDGMENSSKEYSKEHVQKLIKKVEKKGGEFNFLCSDLDVQTYHNDIGSSVDYCLSFDDNPSFEKDLTDRVHMVSESIILKKMK